MSLYTKEDFLNLNKLLQERASIKNRFGENYFLSNRKGNTNVLSEETMMRRIKPIIISELLKHPKCEDILNIDTLEIFSIKPKGLLVQFKLNDNKVHSTSARWTDFADSSQQLILAMTFDLLNYLYYEVFHVNYLDYLPSVSDNSKNN